MRCRWGLSLLLCLAPAWAARETAPAVGPSGQRHVAIIGAGAAGASTAYHLQQFAQQRGFDVNMTVFESTGRVGGRTLTVNVLDDARLPIELGASIFISSNRILYEAAQRFGLVLGDPAEAESGDVTAIWDGDGFVYQSEEGTAGWWEAGQMLLRYGLTPFRTLKLVREVVATFLKMYDEPYFPFRSLTKAAYDLGLERLTGVTGAQYLAEKKLDGGNFARHIVQAATRVNYASNLAYIHGLETMVSFSVDGALAVEGGNWQIFDRMLNNSEATLYRNTSVSRIQFAQGNEAGRPARYLISTRGGGAGGEADEVFPLAFDGIVVAAPWQFSGIKAEDGVMVSQIDEVPYTKLHVTVFTSPHRLRAGFFNLKKATDKAPSNVYTTLGRNEEPRPGADGVGRAGFYSISTLRRVTNPKTGQREFVYKIFSATAIRPDFLSDLLGAEVPEGFLGTSISWYQAHWFHSYARGLPRVTFQDPEVGRGVYYSSGIESFISTMETSALMGKNVARLLVDDLTADRSSGRRSAEKRHALNDEGPEGGEAATGPEGDETATGPAPDEL